MRFYNVMFANVCVCVCVHLLNGLDGMDVLAIGTSC